jgi:hypothetical protein
MVEKVAWSGTTTPAAARIAGAPGDTIQASPETRDTTHSAASAAGAPHPQKRTKAKRAATQVLFMFSLVQSQRQGRDVLMLTKPKFLLSLEST